MRMNGFSDFEKLKFSFQLGSNNSQNFGQTDESLDLQKRFGLSFSLLLTPILRTDVCRCFNNNTPLV